MCNVYVCVLLSLEFLMEITRCVRIVGLADYWKESATRKVFPSMCIYHDAIV